MVHSYSHSTKTAEDYGCGNMQADVIPPSAEVLSKYGISVDDYTAIANDIAEKLSFGCCGWCTE